MHGLQGNIFPSPRAVEHQIPQHADDGDEKDDGAIQKGMRRYFVYVLFGPVEVYIFPPFSLFLRARVGFTVTSQMIGWEEVTGWVVECLKS